MHAHCPYPYFAAGIALNQTKFGFQLHFSDRFALNVILFSSDKCSDNDKERVAKFWSASKLQVRQSNQEWKVTKQKFSSLWAVFCFKCRTKDYDRFKLRKLNRMETTFYIIMKILHRKLPFFLFYKKKKVYLERKTCFASSSYPCQNTSFEMNDWKLNDYLRKRKQNK